MPRRLASRLIVAVVALLAFAGAAEAREPDGTLVVTMLGDSLTAGYGLRAADAIPARLEAALKASGLKVKVRAAGVSTWLPSGEARARTPAMRWGSRGSRGSAPGSAPAARDGRTARA